MFTLNILSCKIILSKVCIKVSLYKVSEIQVKSFHRFPSHSELFPRRLKWVLLHPFPPSTIPSTYFLPLPAMQSKREAFQKANTLSANVPRFLFGFPRPPTAPPPIFLLFSTLKPLATRSSQPKPNQYLGSPGILFVCVRVCVSS